MERIALIGFGEAARAFVEGASWADRSATYDIKVEASATREEIELAGHRANVLVCASSATALARASIVLSLVTADQTVAAAREAARAIHGGTLYLDMNSVAPATKRQAAAEIEAAGGRYVDVAVMAPVHPKRREAPLLVGGPHAEPGCDALVVLGFTNVAIAGTAIGAASAIKMIRSVMVKGIEALTAECLLAAEAAGVRDAVIASLDASWPGADWARRGDYNLDRMIVHGIRRADEMDEVVATLDAFGTGSAMARATAERQRAIGARRLSPPDGLDAKLAALLGRDRTMEQAV